MIIKNLALSEKGSKDLKKAIIYSTLGNIALMIPSVLIIKFIDEMLKPLLSIEDAPPSIITYLLVGFLMMLGIYITQSFLYTSTFTASYEESAVRRMSLGEKIRKLPLSFFNRRDLSDLTTTMMGDATSLESTFSHAIPQGIGAVISIFFISVGMFFLEWRMALAIFFTVPISLLIVFGSQKLQIKFTRKQKSVSLVASDNIQEFIQNIKDIKAHNLENKFTKKLDIGFDNVRKAQIRSEFITGTLINSAITILRIGFASVIFIGAILLSNNEISVLMYLIFLFCASRIYEPLSIVFIQIAETIMISIPIERMKNIANEKIQSGKTEFQPENYDIKFENVEFSYNEEKVINNISFRALQGSVTALVGASGSGKSTIAKLIARFWDIQKGDIYIGGENIAGIDPETLLKKISIIFQDVILFNDTIMENIRIGNKNASDDEVYAAAKLAKCDSITEKLPNGYNTIIGENGSTLSGGERQRISIARAILKDAPIILLDEATASLDVFNETLIQSAISKLIKNKTVVVIAHRMRTISSASNIIVLDEGKIAEEGTHIKLLENKNIYSKLFLLQKESANWSL